LRTGCIEDKDAVIACGLLCCNCGLKSPSVLFKGEGQFLCMKDACSCPFSDTVPGPTCGCCAIRCMPSPPGCMKPPTNGTANQSLAQHTMEAVQIGSNAAGTGIGASKLKVHIGPLELSKDGTVMKPKFNIGIEGGSLYAMAGLRDVRDGLSAEGLAMYQKAYSSKGATLQEVLENVKAEEKVPALDDFIVAVPQIMAEVLEATGIDLKADRIAAVEGAVYIYVGTGVSAGLYLGWVDTKGYRMVGVEGKMAVAASMGITVKAGVHENLQSVRITSYLTNVGFDVVVKLKEPAKREEASQV